MPTNYDDEEEKRRLREQTQTIGVDPGNYEDWDGGPGSAKRRLPTGGWAARDRAPQRYREDQGVSPAEAARQGAMRRSGGYYSNPNDLVNEQSYGSNWARSMRARGRLSAPSAAEDALGQARAAQRINEARGNTELRDKYGALAKSLEAQVAADAADERDELEKWLASQAKNNALSYAERQQHQARLDRLHAEDAQLRQDDLARYGIDSRERIAGGTNKANIRVAELGLEGTEATVLGGVEQARIRGEADLRVEQEKGRNALRVEQEKGSNAVRTVQAEAEAAPMAAGPDGTIYDKTDRTGQNIFEKPQKPEQGTTLKPGEVYRDSSGKLTVAPGAEEADINRQIVALYEAAYQPGQSEAARADALARVNALREELARRRQPAGQAAAGAGGPKNFL